MKIFLLLSLIFCVFNESSHAIPAGQAYLPLQKRQTPDFGPNSVVTRANCDLIENGVQRKAYECYEGQPPIMNSNYNYGESQSSISNYIQPPDQLYNQASLPQESGISNSFSGRVDSLLHYGGSPEIVKANCETTEDGIVEENGSSVHKIVLMCYDDQQGQIGSQNQGYGYGAERNPRRTGGPAYLPEARSKRSTSIYYYDLDNKSAMRRSRKSLH